MRYGAILYAFKNAKAVAEGKLAPSALGVRAEGTRTLIIELEHPAPYLPELRAHNITYPVPRHVIEAKGAAWTQPGNYVSNGPYVLTMRVPNDHVTLTKNPRFARFPRQSHDRAALRQGLGGECARHEPPALRPGHGPNAALLHEEAFLGNFALARPRSSAG